jgi:hypothetical protein
VPVVDIEVCTSWSYEAETSPVPPPANGNGHDDGFKDLMKKCVQDAADIVKDVNTIPRQNEDVRSIALTMFIQRARGRNVKTQDS